MIRDGGEMRENIMIVLTLLGAIAIPLYVFVSGSSELFGGFVLGIVATLLWTKIAEGMAGSK